jgi:CRISPR/Cas system-associated exonuclease Cas4 (RecB family)
MRVENVQAVVDGIKRGMGKYLKDGKRVVVAVGFTQAYAIYVHEDMEAHHPVGQAKYLEQPARELRQDLGNIVTTILKAGESLSHALLTAGLRLQREAQELVPVDTGALKASAFTREEKD